MWALCSRSIANPASSRTFPVIAPKQSFLAQIGSLIVLHKMMEIFSKFSRVEMWRGGLGMAYLFPPLLSDGASIASPCSVSTSRSSNRTCGFPASGSPTAVAFRHTLPTLSRRLHLKAKLVSGSPGLSLEVIGLRHSPDLCSLPKRVRSQAPSLHRHYPASQVLRASPPPHTARPGPRRLPVGKSPPPLGLPVLHRISLYTCRRHYPGGTVGCSRCSLPQRRRPSPKFRRVGSRIALFEAC